MNRILFALISIIALSLFLHSSPPAVLATATYYLLPDITYKTTSNLTLKLDICSPPNLTKSVPTLIFFHSGGLRGGTRTQGFSKICAIVTPHGYSVITADYRLAPTYPYPAQIDDAQYAIRWIRAHATQYHVNPNQIIVSGSSAGAALAATVATLNSTRNSSYGLPDISSRVQGAILLAGVYDFTNPALLGSWNPTVYVFQNNRTSMQQFSAITHISIDDGPFLLLHGTEDSTNLPLQSTRMKNAFHSAGIPVRLFTFSGVHSVGNFDKPAVQQVVSDFLNQYFPLESLSSLPGDFNGDNKVDLSDYNLLISNFGNPYTIFDYNKLVANFGK